MENKKENVTLNISGLKCDNPNCDYRDESVKYEDYKNWVGKPCPKCGQILLTEKDYKICRFLTKLTNLFNRVPMKKVSTKNPKRASVKMELNGTGDVNISEIKYY